MGLATAATTVGIGACSGGEGPHTPSVGDVPLVPGGNVVLQTRDCNSGANAYCGIVLVVQNRRYASSRSLVLAERDRLRANGWSGVSPDSGNELANESPGNKLRLTYATAANDLQGVELGWIARPGKLAGPFAMTLDRAVFSGVPTMSLLLETGVQ